MDDKGFQKLNVSVPVEAQPRDVVRPRAMEARSQRKRRFSFRFPQGRVARTLAIVVLLLVLAGAYTSIQAFGAYKQARKVEAQAKVAYDALKAQNIVLAKDELVKTQTEVKELQKDLGSIGYMKFVPVAGWYYNDAVHMVNAASEGVDAGVITTETLIPYADVLGLKGDSSFAGGSAQDRIRLAVNTMSKVVPEIDRIEAKLIAAQKEIDQIDPKKYPNIGKIKKVREMIDQLKTVSDGAVVAVEQGKPLIKSLPDILGESEEKKYLVLFQNNAELRPTGGFLTYYTIFKVNEGVITVDTSSDIYDLDNSISKHPAAPEIITKYLPKVNQLFIRDSNLSPDFIKSMDAFNEQFENSSRFQEVDGIVAIDVEFFVNMVRILGEVNASGLTFKADIDPRCNCPQVVYELENEISRPVNYVKTDRKGLLADLMLATMDKAMSSSPKEYWGKLFQQLIADAQQKHIMFYMYDENAQKGLKALNWTGEVRDFEGDYLNVNDANFGGQKSNLFVEKSMRIDYEVSNDGTVKKKVLITYKNPMKASDCNLERGGLCLNAPLRNYQRVYVPKGSTLDKSAGSSVKSSTKEDLGKTYFDAFFIVNPLGKAEVSYEYTLPFKVEKGSPLPVLIQKQPGAKDVPTEIYVNGKLKEKFDLTTDKEINIDL